MKARVQFAKKKRRNKHSHNKHVKLEKVECSSRSQEEIYRNTRIKTIVRISL